MTWHWCNKCGYAGASQEHAGCPYMACPVPEDSEAENDHQPGLEQNESEWLEEAMGFDIGGEA